jgi:prepilin-type N-terminal cleavage/methylation domain-containing protein
MKGFTLIEVCIVIVIISILFAVMLSMPAQQKAKEDFFASCTKVEPQYSCDVKWKQIHPDPIVVFAPLNR